MKLKECRIFCGLTQQNVADSLGITYQAYSHYENERRTPDIDTIYKLAKLFNVEVDYLIGKSNNNEKPNKSVKIPVLGVIHAGLPVEAVENIIDYEEISMEMANKGEYFALKVNGDSMLPTFINGDIVVVRKQSDADNGNVCVVMVNGDDATLKRIKKDENGILLIPDNPSYSTMQYSNKEIEEKPVRIIGKVVELRRSF